MDAELKRELERINKKLNSICQVQRKETWVKISIVRRLTILTREDMRDLRERKQIVFRRSVVSGFEYLLQSIPKELFKNNTHESKNDQSGNCHQPDIMVSYNNKNIAV
ncbi:MAG TPA: hypothetical protein VMZ03_03995 [Chitinophagaceae bacterium]|nr:hypothetical protein [Chitinophagaceae bacterium]